MVRAVMTTEDHRRKVLLLRLQLSIARSDQEIALSRIALETLRNPVVARAVARGLRLGTFEKA